MNAIEHLFCCCYNVEIEFSVYAETLIDNLIC